MCSIETLYYQDLFSQPLTGEMMLTQLAEQDYTNRTLPVSSHIKQTPVQGGQCI